MSEARACGWTIVLGAVALTLVVSSLAAATAEAAPRQARCTKVAAKYGSDRGRGTRRSPYRTAQRLVRALNPGKVGCLRRGVYRENVRIARGGKARRPVTIRSYPGERAKIRGRLWVSESGDHVRVSLLRLDGSAGARCQAGTRCTVLPSPTVNGDHVAFSRNDVTNRGGICFNAGSRDYGRAYRLTLRRNRIHDCGRLPATNHDHGIYLQRSTGARIVSNLIYNNADRGIQLYPDAQGSYIARNVIDGNGEGIVFSGDYGVASSGTVVERNLITNSKIRNNVESWYPARNPIGEHNVVQQNCIHGGARDDGDGGIGRQRGFLAADNLLVDPLYVNRAANDFRLRRRSLCYRFLR